MVLSSWKRLRLGDVLALKHGFAFKGKYFSNQGEYILLTPGNFQIDGGLKFKGNKEKYYSGEFPEEYLLEKNDLLIAMTDLTQTAAILGSSLFIPENGRFLHNQRLGKIENLSPILDSQFLYHLFNYRGVREQIKGSATGSTVRHTAPERIYRVEAFIPPLPTQRKIASILSAYDDLIENNLRRIKILEEMAQNLYREWFVKFRFPGHEKVKFVDSPMGKIPEGWEIQTVQDTFQISGGGTPSKQESEYWKNGTINWYTPTDLTRSGMMFSEQSKTRINGLGLKKSSARLFPPYSVMMTSRATLGVISINTTEATTNQGFITCMPNDQFPLHILHYWLKENVDIFISLGTGATFKEITKGVFKKIHLIVPDQDILDKYEGLVSPITSLLLNLQRSIENLRQTRDLLLPKLISGKLDVSDLDIKVPKDIA